MTEPTIQPLSPPLLSLAGVRALHAIEPHARVAAPPRRVAMAPGRECLVRWQESADSDGWVLELLARSTDWNAPTHEELPSVVIHFPAGGSDPAARWQAEDPAFAAWVAEHLGAIAAEIAAAQPDDYARAEAYAGSAGGISQRLVQLVPHLVLVAAIGAFVYMFSVVHIY